MVLLAAVLDGILMSLGSVRGPPGCREDGTAFGLVCGFRSSGGPIDGDWSLPGLAARHYPS